MVAANASRSKARELRRPLLKPTNWIRDIVRKLERFETQLPLRSSKDKQFAERLAAQLDELANIADRCAGRHEEGFGYIPVAGRRPGMRLFQRELAAECAHALGRAGVTPRVGSYDPIEATIYSELVRGALLAAEIRDRRGNVMVFDFMRIAVAGLSEYRRVTSARP